MSRALISIGECRLLTRRNANCGQLGKERFDHEVAPRCPPRYIDEERFYDRADLDAWYERCRSIGSAHCF